MTREEAIKTIENRDSIMDYCESAELGEALDMAIEALSAEPCEDVISRQAVLDVTERELFKGDAISEIEKLPSVTQKPKMGRWIMPVQDDGMSDPIYYQVRCSECGFDLDPQTWHMELHQYGADKYCPNCGARMGESED